MKLFYLLAGATAMASASPALATPSPQRAFIPIGEVADAPEGFNQMCTLDSALCTQMGITSVPAVVPVATQTATIDRLSPTGSIGACAPASTNAACSAVVQPVAPQAPVAMLQPATFDPFASAQADSCAYPVAPFIPRLCDVSAAFHVVAVPIQPTFARAAAPETTAEVLPSDFKMIRKLNSKVNHRVRPVSDMDLYGVDELWTRPKLGKTMAGDCEDIAIEKRMELIDAGVARDRLSFAVVYSKTFGLHTVLVVRMTDGDYVLDSLSSRAARWDETDYRWLRLESREHPGTWMRVSA